MDNNSISNTSLTGFGPLVERLGGDPDALLAKVGLSPEALASGGAMIPLDAVTTLLENAAATLPCLDFGMRLAEEREGVPTIPLLQPMLRNAPTLGAMLRQATDRQQLYSPGVAVFLDPAPDIGSVVQRFDIAVDGLVFVGQFMEHILLLVYRTVVYLTGARRRPREIWFSHARISPMHEYGRRFVGCEVRFGQEYDGVFFAPEDCEQPIAGHDEAVFAREAQAIDARFPAPAVPLERRLHETLQAVIRHGLYTRADAARIMGMSISSLQRRLARTGHSFEGIRDDVRRQLALRYLARGDLPLSEIAPKLGYAELAVLSRSCRRWFGRTPAALRRELIAHRLERLPGREVNTAGTARHIDSDDGSSRRPTDAARRSPMS